MINPNKYSDHISSKKFNEDLGITFSEGWTPVLGVEFDGERQVLKVVDFIRNSEDENPSTKPPIPSGGYYLGESNEFVLTVEDATNIRGGVWYTGVGTPAESLGEDGDMYLNTADSFVFSKLTGSWVSVGSIRGDAMTMPIIPSFDESTVTEIETEYSGVASLTSPYYAAVDDDDRVNQSLPAGISGDVSNSVIAYDGTTWYNLGLITGLVLVKENLNDLDDVNTTGVTTGGIIRYNGSTWEDYDHKGEVEDIIIEKPATAVDGNIAIYDTDENKLADSGVAITDLINKASPFEPNEVVVTDESENLITEEKNTAFNKDFTTSGGKNGTSTTVERGDHYHTVTEVDTISSNTAYTYTTSDTIPTYMDLSLSGTGTTATVTIPDTSVEDGKEILIKATGSGIGNNLVVVKGSTTIVNETLGSGSTDYETIYVTLRYANSTWRVVNKIPSDIPDATATLAGIVTLNGIVTPTDNVTNQVNDATTSSKGKVQLAPNGGTTSGTVIQANDNRLAQATTTNRGTIEIADDTDLNDNTSTNAITPSNLYRGTIGSITNPVVESVDLSTDNAKKHLTVIQNNTNTGYVDLEELTATTPGRRLTATIETSNSSTVIVRGIFSGTEYELITSSGTSKCLIEFVWIGNKWYVLSTQTTYGSNPSVESDPYNESP